MESNQENINTSNLIKTLQTFLLLEEAINIKATYQIQFVDNDNDTWTIPCQLTKKRMKDLLNDNSINKIRLEFSL